MEKSPKKSAITWLRKTNGEYYAVDDDLASWRLYCQEENGYIAWVLYRNGQRIYATGTRAHAKQVADLWVTGLDDGLPDPVPSRRGRPNRWRFAWIRSQKRRHGRYSYHAFNIESASSWSIIREGYGARNWVVLKNGSRFGEADSLAAAKQLCEEHETAQ